MTTPPVSPASAIPPCVTFAAGLHAVRRGFAAAWRNAALWSSYRRLFLALFLLTTVLQVASLWAVWH
ncbi:MAG: hypothetical protein ACPGUV_05355 [Polyangiales bacterium]